MKHSFTAFLVFCSVQASSLPTLSSNGGSITLTGGASASLTFSANNAEAQTTVAVAPVPAPTPKWPLPDQIAGYTVTLSNTVTFTAFPPVMCVTGAFPTTRTYVLDVSDSSGRNLAQLPATVTALNVCTAPVRISGQMQANEPYTFVMTMSTQ